MSRPRTLMKNFPQSEPSERRCSQVVGFIRDTCHVLPRDKRVPRGMQ
jgi:hypothetical protein